MKDEFGSAVILAGGKSTRMGFDKKKLSLNGKHLLEWQINTLRSIFGELIIVTGDNTQKTINNCKTVCDGIPGAGPLGGISAGLAAASSKFVYVLACDMPNINIEYVSHMTDRLRNTDYDACVTRFGKHIEPFNAFYSKHLVSHFESFLLGCGRSVYGALKGTKCLYVAEEKARNYSPCWEMFDNLNTREELYDYAEKIYASSYKCL